MSGYLPIYPPQAGHDVPVLWVHASDRPREEEVESTDEPPHSHGEVGTGKRTNNEHHGIQDYGV